MCGWGVSVCVGGGPDALGALEAKEWAPWMYRVLISPLPSPAGVNSFMVYMAYKDLYQVSNTEVMTHPVWLGFPGDCPTLPVTLALCA